jgi:predicted 3-demethylubiquinone-9 3-methyltransferase (glyoxalase superfamily)
MKLTQKIRTCLWFDGQAEEAAAFYVAVFGDGRIGTILRYGSVGREIHGHAPGDVLVVEFELHGQPFMALNGGPQFKFDEAISFVLQCDTQDEIDHYWNALSDGGDERAQRCGWLKDRYGVSWQVVPTALNAMLTDPDAGKADRVMAALLRMRKLDIAELQQACEGLG